jgi:integrase/recombinase XerD
MLLSKALQGFLLALASDGHPEATQNIYRRGIEILIEYAGDVELAAISETTIRDFWLWAQRDYVPRRASKDTSPLKPASLDNVWTAIRAFYNWAEAELGIIRPDGKLKRPRYQPNAIYPFSQEDIKSLLTKAQTLSRNAERDKAILLTLLDTGLRVGELCRLRIGDLNLATGELRVAPFGSGQKSKARAVYIGKAARRAVWRIVIDQTDPAAYLFASTRSKPMHPNAIRWMMRRLGKKAGVSNLHPHRFRHTFAIQFLRNGGDVFSLQRLLGHSTLDMVKRYLALADADLANAHEGASPVDRWGL